MFLWTDPFSQNLENDQGSGQQTGVGLVSARWLALDAILRSLILDPEGPEMRAMMRRDLQLMKVTGRVSDTAPQYVKPYVEAADVLVEWTKALSS